MNEYTEYLCYILCFSAIEIPFWIIDTDYDNYALAYACVDQPEDLRAGMHFFLNVNFILLKTKCSSKDEDYRSSSNYTTNNKTLFKTFTSKKALHSFIAMQYCNSFFHLFL